jgi:hypothetical protein
VTATVKGCATEAVDKTTILQTSETILVLVDENIGAPSCAFSQGPDLNPVLDISQAEEFCGKVFFQNIEEATDCVSRYSVAQDAVGNCRPVDIDVKETSLALPSDLSSCTKTYDITVRVGLAFGSCFMINWEAF